MLPTYLVDHPRSGRALFSKLDDAREWADEQTRYHCPDITVHWIDGGGHGWHAQRTASGGTFDGAATMYALQVDQHAPRDDFDEDEADFDDALADPEPHSLETLTHSTTWDVESEGHGNYWFVLSEGFTSYEQAERRMNARGAKAAADVARIVRNVFTRSIDHGPGSTEDTGPDMTARVLQVADLIEAGAPWTANHQDTADRIRRAVNGSS